MCWPTSKAASPRLTAPRRLTGARWHRHRPDVDAPDVANPDVDGVVLIVEDDTAVREAVDRGLTVHGFTVRSVGDAEQAQRSVARDVPAVMVVDVGLPGMSGIELCTTLRANAIDVPILILSARDAGRRSRRRPARRRRRLPRQAVRARRARRPAPRPAAAGGAADRSGRREVGRRTAVGRPRPTPGDRQLEPLDLSRREFDLLSTFVANPGIVLSRIRLLELVWGYDFDVDTNVVDVFVGYLRRKLAAAGLPKIIETVRGVGFVLRIP